MTSKHDYSEREHSLWYVFSMSMTLFRKEGGKKIVKWSMASDLNLQFYSLKFSFCHLIFLVSHKQQEFTKTQ